MTAPAGRRGRPPRHTLTEVVTAAVELADAEGLAGVTMRAVATRLGAGTMSLYSYVPDKQALVREMVERVGEEFRTLPGPTGDWRADVHRLARRQRELVHRHPWLLDAVTHVAPLGPGTLTYLEAALAALEPSGMDPASALETASLITGFTLNIVRAELAERAAGRRTAEEVAAQAGDLARLLGTGRYPRVAAAVGVAHASRVRFDLDTEFDRLLDRLLDGLVPSG